MDMRKIVLGPTVFLGGYFTSSSTPRHSFHLIPIRNIHKKSDSWPSTADELTPYRVLGLQPGEPYRKSAFYERAKLYHPDRHRTVPSALAPTVRASRYRMIVAAHELLSDPHKRQAYDRWGVGWMAAPQKTAGGARRTYTYAYSNPYSSAGYSPYASAGYSPGGSGSGAGAGAGADAGGFNHYNTTDKVPLALRFFCTRSGLLLVVVILVFLQTCLFIVQYNKAQLRAWQVHQHCQRLLERRRTRAGDFAGLPATQLERFLLNRDPSGMGLTGEEVDIYRGMLPTCAYGPV
ncbi:J domain-containing protein [Aspergillus homomorphus CBS 101889]|uniref:J domain-containing protein n=1 Tax=Aspergillus homomorphus (strain CBS 101889) TaxID=1450537 RepID=A0A395HQN2_ASPHC|nr:hypothetical protein BO97DRAFT_444812 [Aspergillus homomorphus CBS 101889]RAL10127.1 hypothetical protein BO97DRAFT_444812 [Aspergillus homomorphus CBS 101889]